MNPRPEQVKPNDPIKFAQERLDMAKKEQSYWHEQIKEVQLKQVSKEKYAYFTDKAQEKIHEVSEYEKKFEKLLDEPIIIDPDKHSQDMISFSEIDERASAELIHTTGIYELGSTIIRFYASSKDPRRRFEIAEKTHTTLRSLFRNFKLFLEEQLLIPEPTQEEITASQEEVNKVWAEYRNYKEEVERLEEAVAQG